ncbi:Na(+)/H(+) antiporter subunit C [Desulfitibacter alkalitolerans]|uniref:Na(+)/H(+) antiporter subunit C n=1 Tax=Desulfitibacter alkalitolerans TaxID=264641 RepID=UPI0004874149|nr:Na(+)/H(+) antiporter subunit C [Desulfitibacter alkalitolerans]
MELMMSLVIGVLFAAGTYLLLSRSMLRVILGTALLSHGVLLMILTMGKLKRGAPPIIIGAGPFTDPLPQALILTAIVIGFGVTSFVLVLAYRAYQTLKTDDLDKLRGVDDE